MSTDAAVAEPFGRIVERGAGAGEYLIELVDGEDAALRDDWGDDDGRVRIQPGRVGSEQPLPGGAGQRLEL